MFTKLFLFSSSLTLKLYGDKKLIASIVSAGVLVKSPPDTMSVLSAPTYVVPSNVEEEIKSKLA